MANILQLPRRAGEYYAIQNRTITGTNLGNFNTYCLLPLFTGRPMGKVMIVLSGKSGAGKSTTINRLFEDPDLCPTSSVDRKTTDIHEYGKVLRVLDTDQTTTIVGTLSFLDLPGGLGHHQGTEDEVIAKIESLKAEGFDLADRNSDDPDCPFKFVRKKVHPNLVLAIVKADSGDLEHELASLRDSPLIDTQFLNLIVVATHAMYISGRGQYASNVESKTKKIQSIIRNLLNIDEDVNVVFIENSPDDWDLPKKSGSDFYQLPDGGESHKNLMDAISGQFASNGDSLGLLFCGWYFGKDCPDRKTPVRELPLEKSTKISDYVTNFFKKLDMRYQNVEKPKELSLIFVGHTMDPRSQQPGPWNKIYVEDSKKVVEIGKHQYTIPDLLHVVDDRLSTIDFNRTQGSSIGQFGANIKLSARFPQIHFDGLRLGGNRCKFEQKDLDSQLIVERAGYITLAQPSKDVSIYTDVFLNAIQDLPEEFNGNTKRDFYRFLDTWGSHLILRTPIGYLKSRELEFHDTKFLKKAVFGSDVSINPAESLNMLFSQLGLDASLKFDVGYQSSTQTSADSKHFMMTDTTKPTELFAFEGNCIAIHQLPIAKHCCWGLHKATEKWLKKNTNTRASVQKGLFLNSFSTNNSFDMCSIM